MAEHEAQLCEVPSVVRILVEHLLLALLEQFNCLLALPHQIIDEHAKVLVAVQQVRAVLVFAVNQPQPLIRVRQNV